MDTVWTYTGHDTVQKCFHILQLGKDIFFTALCILLQQRFRNLKRVQAQIRIRKIKILTAESLGDSFISFCGSIRKISSVLLINVCPISVIFSSMDFPEPVWPKITPLLFFNVFRFPMIGFLVFYLYHTMFRQAGSDPRNRMAGMPDKNLSGRNAYYLHASLRSEATYSVPEFADRSKEQSV